MLTRWQRQTSAFQTVDGVEGSQPIEAMRKPKASLRLIQQPSIFKLFDLLCNIEDFMGDGPHISTSSRSSLNTKQPVMPLERKQVVFRALVEASLSDQYNH